MDHAVVESALATLARTASRELDRDCTRYAERYFGADVEPQFDVVTDDFAADPYLICADRYWNLRFTREPALTTAVNCAGWLNEHVAQGIREAVSEKWAMGYAFITRSSVESAGEIADATRDVLEGHDQDGSRALFATLYHGGKLRANLRCDELDQFLKSSPLAIAAGVRRNSPLFLALQAFAAFGSRSLTDRYAIEQFEHAWQGAGRSRETIDVALNGLAIATPFDAQGPLLRSRAAEAVKAYPTDHMFHFRLAFGEYLCGDYDSALTDIDSALDLLPAIGWRGSHDLLLEQYTSQRAAIVNARAAAARDTARQARLDRHEQQLADMAGSVRQSVLRAVELVTIFAAVIAFAVGSLQVTLNGSLRVADRAWLIAELGAGLLIFALVIVGGTWLISRSLDAPKPGGHRTGESPRRTEI
jgi:hypothetical protein